MRTIVGVTPATEGEIKFNGESIRHLRPDQITGKGINYVPQERNVFPDLTVQENLEMGAFLIHDPKDRIEKIYLQFPILKEAQQAVCRHAQRRRAADAGSRMCASYRSGAADS